MAEYALFARDAGAKIIGGCCGTSPAHISAMVVALNGTAKRSFDSAAMTAVLGEAWKGLLDMTQTDARLRSRHRGRRH